MPKNTLIKCFSMQNKPTRGIINPRCSVNILHEDTPLPGSYDSEGRTCQFSTELHLCQSMLKIPEIPQVRIETVIHYEF